MYIKREISCVVTSIIRPLSRVSVDILVLLLHKRRTRAFSETVWENFTHGVMRHLKLRWYITALHIKLRTITVYDTRISGTYNLSQDREFNGWKV